MEWSRRRLPGHPRITLRASYLGQSRTNCCAARYRHASGMLSAPPWSTPTAKGGSCPRRATSRPTPPASQHPPSGATAAPAAHPQQQTHAGGHHLARQTENRAHSSVRRPRHRQRLPPGPLERPPAPAPPTSARTCRATSKASPPNTAPTAASADAKSAGGGAKKAKPMNPRPHARWFLAAAYLGLH